MALQAAGLELAGNAEIQAFHAQELTAFADRNPDWDVGFKTADGLFQRELPQLEGNRVLEGESYLRDLYLRQQMERERRLEKMFLASMYDPSQQDVHKDTFVSNIFIQSMPMEFQANLSVPTKLVPKTTGKYAVGDSARYRIIPEGLERAPYDEARSINLMYGQDSYETTEYALRCFIADQIQWDADLPINPRGDAAMAVAYPLMNLRDRTVGGALTTASNYTLVENTANLLTADDADIPTIINKLQNKVSDQCGRRPGRFICNENTMNKILASKSIRGDQSEFYPDLTPARKLEAFARKCGLSRVVIYHSSHNTAEPLTNPTEDQKGKTPLNVVKNFPDNKACLIHAEGDFMRSTNYACLVQWRSQNFMTKSYRIEGKSVSVNEMQTAWQYKVNDPRAGYYLSSV